MLVVATVQRRPALKVVVRRPGAPAVIHTVPRCTHHLQEPYQLLQVAGPLTYWSQRLCNSRVLVRKALGAKRTSRVDCGLAAQVLKWNTPLPRCPPLSRQLRRLGPRAKPCRVIHMVWCEYTGGLAQRPAE